MNWRCLGLLPIAALLSCAAPKAPQPLAVQAADGNAIAACKLAVQDMRQCAAARDTWLGSGSGERPACMKDVVPSAHETYLTDAVGRLKGGHAKNVGDLVIDGVLVFQAAFQIGQPAAEAIELLDLIEPLCPRLAQE